VKSSDLSLPCLATLCLLCKRGVVEIAGGEVGIDEEPRGYDSNVGYKRQCYRLLFSSATPTAGVWRFLFEAIIVSLRLRLMYTVYRRGDGKLITYGERSMRDVPCL
jgi:hypothetical protein